MDTTFKEISFEYDILTTFQYEKSFSNELSREDTTLNLETSFESISKKTEETKKKQEKLKLECEKKSEVAKTESKSRIGIIKTAPVKSNNDFLNTVQNNENTKRELEEKRIKNSNVEFPYIKGTLFTNAEMQLYHFMRNNLDCKEQIVIFPKVRLADLIEVDNKITLDKSYFYKISSKHVDYVICKYDTLEIICVVELDDFYHNLEEKKQRDLFVMEALYTAGIEVIRIKVPIKTICKEDLDYLDERINTVLAPPCPYCGVKMTPKKSMHKSNKGHRFYSCPNFINGCRHTINIDQIGEKLP